MSSLEYLSKFEYLISSVSTCAFTSLAIGVIALAVSTKVGHRFVIKLSKICIFLSAIIYISTEVIESQKKSIAIDAGIRALSDSNSNLIIDGEENNQLKTKLRESLLACTRTKPSGSHIDKLYRITITRGDSNISLQLGKDSKKKDLYWVTYPAFKHRNTLCFARIEGLVRNSDE